MLAIKPVINNIRDTKITQYLKSKGIKKQDINLNLIEWIDMLLREGKVSEKEINDCVLTELLYGHRRLVRIYGLKNIRKIKREEDWKKFLEKYDCQSLNFNNILHTTLMGNEKVRVCAISTKIENQVIKRVQIIFVYNMTIKNKTNETISNCYTYIPVILDLEERIITLKVWNKEDGIEGSTPLDQLDIIMMELQSVLEFETKIFSVDPQSVLYRMSKALFNDFFKNLPNVTELENKKEFMPDIVNMLLQNIQLTNSKMKNGMKTMDVNVINVEDEIYKLLQQIALYDYLKDHDLICLLQNTDRYISRIKFSDIDNLTASLNSENGVKCIFDAKTFMCVRNSLDLVEQIVSIVVSFPNNSGRGILSAKYDASDTRYLTIHILNNRYYTEDDFKKIWELYKKYEPNNAEISNVYIQSNTKTM